MFASIEPIENKERNDGSSASTDLDLKATLREVQSLGEY